MIFRFIITKLKWLAGVPLLPHVFDSALLISTSLFDRRRLRAREIFENEIVRLDEVRLAPHRFGGVGFFVGKKEIGHIHGNGLLDLLVGKSARTDFVSKGLALPHHVLPNSGWVSFWLTRPDETAQALELFDAARAYRLKSD